MENLIREKFLRIDVDGRGKKSRSLVKTKRFIGNLWDDVSYDIELSCFFYHSFSFILE